MFSSQLGVELEKSAYFVSFVHTLKVLYFTIKMFPCVHVNSHVMVQRYAH